MADVIVQGTPLAPAQAPPTKSYRLKAGRSIVGVPGGGGSVNLTDAQAHAFRDKLEPSQELTDAVAAVEYAGDRREQLHTSPVPQVNPQGIAAPAGGPGTNQPNQVQTPGKVNPDGTNERPDGSTQDAKTPGAPNANPGAPANQTPNPKP